MIDDSTTVSTAELCGVLDCTKGHISHLERDGVIFRTGRNTWALVKTLRAVIEHMRSQRQAASDWRGKFEAARAAREEQRLAKEAHQLVRCDEFDDAWQMTFGYFVSRLIGLPARCSRDLAVRREIEAQINALRAECADEYQRQAESLRSNGKAAPFGK